MEGFEHAHMENIMNSGTWRQAETICNFTNPFSDLEWSGILGTEFSSCARLQSSCMSIQQAKPYTVIDVELQWSMVDIIVALGMFLSLKKSFFDIGYERVTFLEKCVHRCCAC
jgi:hypothetical protein